MLGIAGVLLAITILAGLLGFGVIRSPILVSAKIVFFVAGTLLIPALLVGLVEER